jgi:small-conductance mechanosensitive channel
VSLLRLLLPLLPELLRLLPEAPHATQHLGRGLAVRAAIVLIPLLLLLLLTAAFFAIAAAYMALAEALSPPAAAAIMALALCGLVGLEAAVVIALNRAAERRRAQAAQRAREDLMQPLEEAGRLIGAKPLPSVLLAMAAGTLVALWGRRR